MKKGISAIILTFLLIIIFFSGCFENDDENTELTANQIIADLIAANNNINSYKYTSDSTHSITIFNNSDTNITNYSVLVAVSIDVSNHSLKYLEDIINTETSEKNQRYIYLLDEFEYRGTGTNDNITWEIYPLYESTTEAFWFTFSPLEKSEERWSGFIENNTFERLEDDIFEGKEYYVLGGVLTTNYTNEAHLGYDLCEWQYKYWIDKTTNLIYKQNKTQILDETDYYFDGDWGDRELIINEYEINYYDYNIPITIEIPEEALG